MLSADECLAKAKALSDAAVAVPDQGVRAYLLAMAEHWLNISRLADWQDSHPLSETYRIR
jgi:hypothetical protein